MKYWKKSCFVLRIYQTMSGVIVEPKKVMSINFGGTKNLVEALGEMNYRFFVNTGTFAETYSADDYSKSKKEATEFCQNYAQKNTKPIVTLQLFTPYGPFIQKGRLIFNVLVNAMSGNDIKMTSPDIVRNFIYVDDLVDLYFAVAEKAKESIGEIFSAASETSITLKEVVDTALKITSSKCKVIWGALPTVSYDTVKIDSDIQKTIICLNWKPKTTFEEGLKKNI